MHANGTKRPLQHLLRRKQAVRQVMYAKHTNIFFHWIDTHLAKIGEMGLKRHNLRVLSSVILHGDAARLRETRYSIYNVVAFSFKMVTTSTPRVPLPSLSCVFASNQGHVYTSTCSNNTIPRTLFWIQQCLIPFHHQPNQCAAPVLGKSYKPRASQVLN